MAKSSRLKYAQYPSFLRQPQLGIFAQTSQSRGWSKTISHAMIGNTCSQTTATREAIIGCKIDGVSSPVGTMISSCVCKYFDLFQNCQAMSLSFLINFCSIVRLNGVGYNGIDCSYTISRGDVHIILKFEIQTFAGLSLKINQLLYSTPNSSEKIFQKVRLRVKDFFCFCLNNFLKIFECLRW